MFPIDVILPAAPGSEAYSASKRKKQKNNVSGE
jgi:hypothetical protein